MGYLSEHKRFFNKEKETMKAKKIAAILLDYLGEKKLQKSKCLYLGCTEGLVAAYLGKYCKQVVGIDVDEESIEFAKKNYVRKNVSFSLGDAMNLKYRTGSFDIVVANQLYNYLPNARKMMEEIKRVLKVDGICYFSATQAHFAGDLAGGKTYNLSYSKLKKLVKGFKVMDYTVKVIKNPRQFFYHKSIPFEFAVSKLPENTLKLFLFCIPSHIWILEK